MGFVLSYFGSVMGLLIVLWGLTVYFNLWVDLQVIQRFQGGHLEQSVDVIWDFGIHHITLVVQLLAVSHSGVRIHFPR